ncbi:ABC transporter ATP-binding protein [Alkaliphilus transvaalensis]|uniref:ABC transporter ATP-binding protein n=1 Tax=Alkaliphilus transvaalensis TaxID=114628 RepID=UPI000478F271|nr:ABC transporter ATP-binding protein [Alkaliphilus transvaalensis]
MIKLFKYLKPYALVIVAVLVLVFLQSIGDLYLPTLMADIVNNGMLVGNTGYIWRVGSMMLLVAAGGVVAAVTASYLGSRIAMAYGRDLRSRVFSKVEDFSLHEFDKIGTASLITRTTNDITQIQNVVMMMLRMMIMAPMMGIGGMIMAISKDRELAMILAVSLPVLAIGIGIVARHILPIFKSIQKKVDQLNLVARENLTGIRVVRAFNRIDKEAKRFDEANADLTSTAIKANKIMATLMPMMMIIMNLTSVAIIWFGSKRIDMGSLQVGDMMAFLQYAMQIMMSLIMMSMMFSFLPRAQASATRINEILDVEAEIVDPEKEKLQESTRGMLAFKNVTFSYPGAEKPVLNNVSFTTKPGEVTAIIGGTGSGKSTLINLIPRFYDIQSGAIEIDGVDVREMKQEALRSKIGFVPQKAYLFSGSIAENIRFGKEDASEEEIKKAAEIAQATEFINGMKEGYDYTIAQGGTNVSGGQRQRLAIARALVRRPEIYIFDDSFSALDVKTDVRLRTALKKETLESSVLIVAQRVTTVMDADRIIVLDEGKIVGLGKHRELLDSCQVYREIVASQLSEEELA